MTSTSTGKRRKSIFDFEFPWPPIHRQHKSPSFSFAIPHNLPHQKRHHSVSFASDSSSPLLAANRERQQRQRGYSQYSQTLRPSSSSAGNCQHHRSVLSLVMRQKCAQQQQQQQKRDTTKSAVSSRRPSTSSLPQAIVQAVSRGLRPGCSSLSLDDGDSAFCSADSACSFSSSPADKRISGFSSSAGSEVHQQEQQQQTNNQPAPPYPWNAQQKALIATELEQCCSQSLGHLLAQNRRLALTNIGQIEAEDFTTTPPTGGMVLCADGNTQFRLLTLVAPPHQRVVNVGRAMSETESWPHRSPSLRPYNPHSLRAAVNGGAGIGGRPLVE